ncbi:MAG: hypothetical protein ABF904_05270 [Ethanoligenens sp.]
MELMSDGAIAVVDAEYAVVTALHDLFDGTYLLKSGLSACFPFADREASARLLTGQATARTLIQQRDSLHLAFSSNAETKAVFSPSFQVMLVYTLEGAALRVECTVNNIGADTALPFYLGLDLHPHCPLFDWEEAADYSLQTQSDGNNADTVRLFSRRTGRGMELSWKGFAFQQPKDAVTSGSACLTLDTQGIQPLAPMESWRGQLRVTLL